MDMDDGDGELEMLMGMGFPKERCIKALSVNGNAGIEAAANWLLTHSEDSQASGGGYTLGTMDDAATGTTSDNISGTEDKTSTDNTNAAPLKPSSMKCDDCGKRFKSELDAQAHAARTMHTNFSESTEEIKPLTEEEKKEAIARLEAKRLQKRAEREAQAKQDLKERERIRRKTGQEISQIKHEIEMKEAQKLAEQKKREKLEERRAKEKVRAEIAHAKAERLARNKAGNQERSEQQTATAIPTAQKKDYDTCRLQIRLFGGQSLVNTFNASDTLVDVNKYILMNRTDEGAPYALMTNFPKHLFTGNETSKSLKELGLVPSSVLILTKP